MIIRKLKSNRGESLGESLVAFIIITLCVLIVIAAIQVSHKTMNLANSRVGILNSEENAMDDFLLGLEADDELGQKDYVLASVGGEDIEVEIYKTDRFGLIGFR